MSMISRAAERDGEIALTFADVVRKQIDQELRDAVDTLQRLGKAADVARHPRVAAAQLLKLRDVIRIGQETHVKDQVAVERNAVAVAETDDLHHDPGLLAVAAEFFRDQLAQLVDVELGGVDGMAGHVANRSEQAAFPADAAQDGVARAEGVRTAGLAEAPDDGVIVGFQEEHQIG